MFIYVIQNLLNFRFSGFLFNLVKAVVTEGMASLIASDLLCSFSAITLMNMTHHNTRAIVIESVDSIKLIGMARILHNNIIGLAHGVVSLAQRGC